jgi:acetolactate synthase-1/2/3 large subunit
MVAAGTGNDQIMAARDIRPLFDSDELVADDATASSRKTAQITAESKEGS